MGDTGCGKTTVRGVREQKWSPSSVVPMQQVATVSSKVSCRCSRAVCFSPCLSLVPCVQVCQLYALLLQRPLHIVNCHQHTETSDFLGGLRPARSYHHSTATATATAGGDAHGTDAPPPTHQALFEWHDGPLVTAMRSGHMFLLDELSLADDAVLERLNSVLEPSRRLTLAEQGGATVVEVQAHTDFLFMATMNPGGDFGKRELSPALRNRFTEVWVPHITDGADLLTLIREKLAAASLKRSVLRSLPGSSSSSSSSSSSGVGGGGDVDGVALAATLDAFTQPMLAFVQWFDANASTGAMKKLVDRPLVPPTSGAPAASSSSTATQVCR